MAVLFGLTMRTQDRVTRQSETPDLGVEVTGFQWGWRFRYPAQGVTVVGDANQPPTLVLPVGANVRLRLVAADVIHSFFVPAFLVKRDMIPRCGQLHRDPAYRPRAVLGGLRRVLRARPLADDLRVEVVTPEAFQAFLADQQPVPGGPGPDPTGPGDVGRQASIVR